MVNGIVSLISLSVFSLLTYRNARDEIPIFLGHVVVVLQSLSRVWLLSPQGLQHAMLLCPSPTPRAYSNSPPLSQWYHPTISSSECGVICISEVIDIFPSSLDSSPASSSSPFLLMHSAYKLNKQGDNIQPWCTTFPIWNQSVPCPVLTVASWPAYRFLGRQVRWSGIPISLRIFHSLLWSAQLKALA